jgi:2-phospho-L-lactate guanylyltransferase (CobY/MobA/RfbA family)
LQRFAGDSFLQPVGLTQQQQQQQWSVTQGVMSAADVDAAEDLVAAAASS